MTDAAAGRRNGPGVMISLLTCSMLILMGGAAVAPGLPGIEARFPDSSELVSFIITLPNLAVAAVGFLMGVLCDRMGKRKLLIASLLVFTVTGAGSYFLDNIYAILVLRFLLGFGIAGIICTVTSLIGCYYSGAERVRMLGLQSASMGVGVLLLELLGGILAEMGWNTPFLVYFIAVPLLIMVLIFIREPEISPERTSDGGTDDGSDMKVIAGCYMSIFVGMMLLFLIPTKMPSFMETTMGVSSTLMGLFLGFHGISNAIFSCLHSRIAGRISSMRLVSIAFLLLAVSLFLPMVIGSNVPVCLVTLIVSGIAVGVMIPSIVNSIVSASTEHNRGKMMGIYAVALNLGQFTVSLITIPIFGYVGESYPEMFSIFAVLALVMSLSVMLIFGRGKSVAKAV